MKPCMTFATIACFAVFGSVRGLAQIRQWNSAIPATKYEINQPQRTVTITQGDSGIFKFEAYDGATPGSITRIEALSGVGSVQVLIDGDPALAHDRGASDVRRIDLSGASSGVLVGLDITGTLGADGAIVVDSLATTLSGIVRVDGSLVNGFFAGGGTLNSITIGSNAGGGMGLGSTSVGPISIGGSLTGGLTAGTVGNVAIGGNNEGGITVTSAGNISINGIGLHTGAVRVNSGYGSTITSVDRCRMSSELTA